MVKNTTGGGGGLVEIGLRFGILWAPLFANKPHANFIT